MSDREATTEAILLAAYEEEASLYGRALELAKKLAVELQQGQTDSLLPRILAILDDVRQVEERVTPARVPWQRAGKQPGPRLRAVLVQVTEQIQRLAAYLAEAERVAVERNRRLLPELDAASRGQQMQRAYKQRQDGS